jgi:hypothetical protein
MRSGNNSQNLNPHLVKALSRALRHLHQSAEILTLVTPSLDTLEKRQSVTRLVGDIDALQQRLADLIEFRGSDNPIIPPKPFG